MKKAAAAAAASMISPALMDCNGKKKHPNLVLVFTDQQRGQALGFLNEDPVVTPHLDRFAKQSLVLPQAVSNNPICSPFRGMLMTGQYSVTNGVPGNCTSRTEPYGNELKTSARCWSDVLKDRGYSLGYIGKWHLDAPREPYIPCYNNEGKVKWNDWCPPERRHGFDYWYSYGTYDHHLKPMYWKGDAKRDGFHFVDQWGPEHEADLAIDYLNNTAGQRDPDKPFAMVVSMNPPHPPYHYVPEKYREPYAGMSDTDLLVRPNVVKDGSTDMSQLALRATRNYYAAVTGVDEQFGRIIKAIDAAGLADDTIVLFTSDHGNCLGTHDKKAKGVAFEESMRIPFLVRWQGKIQPRHDDLLISAPDIYPTILGLLGYDSDIPEEVEGTDFGSLFVTGEGKRPTSQLYERMSPSDLAGGPRGVRTARYKLVMDSGEDGTLVPELYDLQADPYEMNDIAGDNPALIKQLVDDELRPWLEKTNDPWIKHIA